MAAAVLDAALPSRFSPVAVELALLPPPKSTANDNAAATADTDAAVAAASAKDEDGSDASKARLAMDPLAEESQNESAHAVFVFAPAPPAKAAAPPAAASAPAATQAESAATAARATATAASEDLVAAARRSAVVAAVATGAWPVASWLHAQQAAAAAGAFIAREARRRVWRAAADRGIVPREGDGLQDDDSA